MRWCGARSAAGFWSEFRCDYRAWLLSREGVTQTAVIGPRCIASRAGSDVYFRCSPRLRGGRWIAKFASGTGRWTRSSAIGGELEVHAPAGASARCHARGEREGPFIPYLEGPFRVQHQAGSHDDRTLHSHTVQASNPQVRCSPWSGAANPLIAQTSILGVPYNLERVGRAVASPVAVVAADAEESPDSIGQGGG